MSNDIFLEPAGPRRRWGLWLVLVVLLGAALGMAWYLATQLRGVKTVKAQKEMAVPEAVQKIIEKSNSIGVAKETATQETTQEPVREPTATVQPEPPPPAPETQKVVEPVPPPPPPTPVVTPPASPMPERAPVAPAATAPAPVPDAAKQLAEARELCKNDRCLQARDLCQQILDKNKDGAIRAEAEALLGEANSTLAFSRRPMPEKTDYTVQVGDTLAGLAKKFTTTKEMIRRSNNFSGDVIRVGDRLRVLNAKWAVTVNKNDNDLLVTMNDKFFKRYGVGTGQYSMTPTGTFHVVSRIEHPTWYRAGGTPIPYGDTNNVLGTHWISLDIPHYGIHGTWETNTIGQQSSQGCIRLLNSNVEELYILLPEGTPVTITE